MNQDNSFEGNPTIVMHLKEGENTGKAMILHGQAPKQLDNLAPVKIDIQGVIHAPLEFLKHRVNDIDQHKAHILVNRDTSPSFSSSVRMTPTFVARLWANCS